ncbi:hypothetical protein BZM27_34620 [Paraburkholderia steynii]|uniref:DUF4331 domain-containing protein n=1 Tax=Paraburkholderia steynii TaxID=1245441 RepID=A0A4R0XEI5_9BURK|nr:hypothetical protein BZM27_34620 [Paraburkholderia steynii]
MRPVVRIMAAVALCAAALWGSGTHPASHREAPLIANDPTADNTDFYMFRSWTNPNNVVFILNVIPMQDPGAGPNYFNFGDDVVYRINIDTNGNGKANDLVYEIRFKTELRGALASQQLPLSYAALPPITALDGAGSDGLILRQSYTVTQVRHGQRTDLGTQRMFAVPSNVGPLTMPNYEALAAQGTYLLANGGKVFAGQRGETFYIDLGAVFDTVNLRRTPPVLTPAEDANDHVNPFGNDTFSGFNISTIAIEVPITTVTSKPNGVIGAYVSTLRHEGRGMGDDEGNGGRWVQVSRMGNPLVNELIIGTDTKDKWNTTDPADEAQFLGFYLNSRLATALNLRVGLTIPTTNRTDLVNVLLKYPSQPQTGTCGAHDCSELLRLNLGVSPTPPAQQRRLSVLAGDSAGWPNGRRPNDDVTDIALRVIAGRLTGVPTGNLLLGDGVNFNVGAEGSNLTVNGIYTVFPYLPTPHDGRNRRHIDCGEAGANPC